MNHAHGLRLLILSHVCLFATGCMTEVKRPTAAVRGMTVGDVTPQGFVMNFEVDVENPNPMALPVADVDYQLRLVGRDFLDGEANPDASIPANGSTPVTLPVRVTFENLLAISDGIRKSGGDVPYELEAAWSSAACRCCRSRCACRCGLVEPCRCGNC